MDEIGYEASEGETLEDNNRSFPLPTSNRNQDPGSSSWEVAKKLQDFPDFFDLKKLKTIQRRNILIFFQLQKLGKSGANFETFQDLKFK